MLAVTFSAYLAAVFLAADADRLGDIELTAAFRPRALGAGAIAAGVLALAGLIVAARRRPLALTRAAARRRARGGDRAPRWPAPSRSRSSWRGRFEPARYAAALAVAAVVAGWALARYPTLLPG